MSLLANSLDDRAGFCFCRRMMFLAVTWGAWEKCHGSIVVIQRSSYGNARRICFDHQGGALFTFTTLALCNSLGLLKSCFTCCIEKKLFSKSWMILSENDGIHCEWYENIPITLRRDFMPLGGDISRSGFIYSDSGLTSRCDII